MNVLVIAPGQFPEAKEIKNGLTAFQTVVGGPIQAVYPVQEPVALICHEEGKLLGLPLNRCLRLEDTGEIYDIIAGTFFLCVAPPDSDRFESLSPEQVEHYTKCFQHPDIFPRYLMAKKRLQKTLNPESGSVIIG